MSGFEMTAALWLSGTLKPEEFNNRYNGPSVFLAARRLFNRVPKSLKQFIPVRIICSYDK